MLRRLVDWQKCVLLWGDDFHLTLTNLPQRAPDVTNVMCAHLTLRLDSRKTAASDVILSLRYNPML